MKPCVTITHKNSGKSYLFEDSRRTVSYPSLKQLQKEVDLTKVKVVKVDLRSVGKPHTSMMGVNHYDQ